MKRVILAALACVAFSEADAGHTIRCDRPQQTMLHFGASDAWSMQHLGTWPDDVQQQTADWLFSRDTTASGQPKGIGLSIWRFNLGAGSSEQGDNSQINHPTRTECMLDSNGRWDWDKQYGQRRFLRMARDRGVSHFVAFCNSAPVFMTRNHLATNTGRGGTINLRDECYDSFASYIATAVKGIGERDGVHIDIISPINEPDGHWNWQGPKQEGSPATNRETARLARALDRAIDSVGIDAGIMLNESSDLRCLLGVYRTSWERGNTIESLFSPDSTESYVGDLEHVLPVVAAHSYWTNTPVERMGKIRRRLNSYLRRRGLSYWQTETCIMSNDEEIGGGGGYDFTMKTALYVARIIHHDITFGNACSWSWWRAVGGDYKDGLLREYPKRKQVKDSRLLWAFGNFSRFVSEGAVRYEVTNHTDKDGVMLSAYKNSDGSWVVVAINYSEKAKPLKLKMSDGSRHQWRLYRTSDAEGETLKPVGTAGMSTTLPARSITTFVN